MLSRFLALMAAILTATIVWDLQTTNADWGQPQPHSLGQVWSQIGAH